MLARLYGTDKSSWGNGYTAVYERHLRPRRKKVVSVLEIGVGGTTSLEGYETAAGGQSLMMWRDYFPKAEILGIDLHPKNISGHRLHFEQGDQSDPDFLRSLVETYRPLMW